MEKLRDFFRDAGIPEERSVATTSAGAPVHPEGTNGIYRIPFR